MSLAIWMTVSWVMPSRAPADRGGVMSRPPREILTTLRVAVVIVVVEGLIRWVSLPRLSRLLGRPSPLTARIPGRTSVTIGGGVWST